MVEKKLIKQKILKAITINFFSEDYLDFTQCARIDPISSKSESGQNFLVLQFCFSFSVSEMWSKSFKLEMWFGQMNKKKPKMKASIGWLNKIQEK